MNLKWKKPLAMLLVVCMLLTILPVAAFAEGEPPVAQIGNAQYNTLQEAVTAAGTTPSTITLLNDTTEDITIAKDQTITLDLGNYTLTNKNDHTIINNGKLTVEGSGTVDNVTHARAALHNGVDGIAVLNGGNFTRSLEAGKSATDNGGNSYYVVLNHGTMTITDGVKVEANGKYSSLIENGWQNGNQNTSGTDSVLTINGGTFTGGLNTIKNDDYGNLTINGGDFNNVAQHAVMNWNVAKITDGTFESTGSCAVWNGYGNDTMDQGQLEITGGTFKAPAEYYVIAHNNAGGSVSISGGTYSSQYVSNATDYLQDGDVRIKQADGTYQVGTPTDDMVKDENGIYFENENLAQTGNKAVVDGTYYSSLSAAISVASAGATVKLIDDVTESVTIDSGKDIVLDLNGKTLNGGTEAKKAAITNYGTLTIQDNSETGTGIIKRGDDETAGYYTIDNQGTMTISGGTITNNTGFINNNGQKNGASLIRNAGVSSAAVLNVTGGTIQQDNFIAIKNDDYGVLNVTGGKIISENESAIQNWSQATISGGEIDGLIWTSVWSSDFPKSSTIISDNAVVKGTIRADQYGTLLGVTPIVEISGGSFIVNWVVANEDYVTVKGGSYAAPVNSAYLDPSLNAELKSAADAKTPYSYYNSVDAALAAAQPGDTVTDLTVTEDNKCTLIFDAAEGELDFVGQSITVASGTKITLPTVSRSGYTFAGWYAGDILAGNAGDSYTVTEDVTLTAKWNRSTSSGSSGSGGFSGTYNYPVKVDSTGDATVTLDKNYAVAGDKVTITVQPKSGKAVDEVIVTDKDDKVIAVTKVGDNKYSFTMPSGQVKVAVTTKAAAYDKRIVLQINNRNVLINNNTLSNDVAPVIVDNRTMVPIRVITEALGGRADWNAETQTVTLTIDGSVLRMTIGQTITGFDAAPVIINDRTYVPIRYVAEKLGANVEWIANTQQIIIEK